jgi:hypothetical protein
MRCLRCGDEMRLVEAVQDKTMTVTRCERHMFECAGCGEIEYRLIASKGPIRRNVQIVHNPDHEPAYAAKDTKSGMVVMRQEDRERLRSLCDWMGWRVVDGRIAGTADSAVAGVTQDQLQTTVWTQGLPSGSECLPNSLEPSAPTADAPNNEPTGVQSEAAPQHMEETSQES